MSSNAYKERLKMENPHQQTWMQKKLWGKNPYKVLLTNRSKAENPMKGKPNRQQFIDKQNEREVAYYNQKQKDFDEYQKTRKQKKVMVNEIKSKKFTRLFDRLK